jgi:cytochrome c biogenesis protein CcdA
LPHNRQEDGLLGHGLQGALLGLVWAPCIGPTVAASLGLLSVAGTRLAGASQLAVFTIGAAFPLLLLATSSRELVSRIFRRHEQRLRTFYRVTALLMIFLGASVLTRWDKRGEAWVTQHLPDWWVSLLARY